MPTTIQLQAPRSLGLTSDNPTQRELALSRAIFTGDANQRRDVARMVSEVARAITDEALRVRLSSTSLFTPNTEAAASIVFQDFEQEVVDLRWAGLFRTLDRRAARTAAFKITNTYNGVEFKTYKIGERINLARVEASRVWYELGILAGGLQWFDFAERWTDDWDASMGPTAMMIRHGKKLAAIAYSTLVASGALTESYDATGSTVLEKDVNTINAAIQKIEDGIYTAANPANGGETEEDLSGPRQYALLYAPTAAMHKRVKAVVQAMNLGPNDNISRAELNKTVVPIDSRNVTAGKFVLVLPGRKNVFAPGIDLELKSQSDITIAGGGEAEVGQSAQAFVRGDSNQVCIASAS